MDKAVKISIIAGVLVVSLSVAYYLVVFLPRKGNTTTDAMPTVMQSPVASEVPVVVEKEPSERALKAAIFFYDNISKERQQKMRETWGGGSDDYRDAVREFATMMDRNKETLIEIEMMIDDYKTKNSQSGSNVTSGPTSSGNSALDQLQQQQAQDCQQDLAKYNSCLAEYNSKLAEYNACQAGNSDPDKMFKSYCSKPFNSCFKPVCAY